MRAAVLLLLLAMAAPLVAIVLLSFSAGSLLTLEPHGFSWRWYADFAGSARWMLATRNSFAVGGATAGIATPIGFMAAWGLWRAGEPRWLAALLTLPLAVPSVIAGLAMYFAAAGLGISGRFEGLVLGHVVLALPYVVLTVLAALRRFDAGLLRAASSLGAGRGLALRRVVLPLLGPAVMGAGLFAFAISFDELIVALFLSGPSTYTLPRQMLEGISDVMTPVICAAAVVVSLVSVAAMGATFLLVRRDGI